MNNNFGKITVMSRNRAKRHKRKFDAVLTIECADQPLMQQLRFHNDNPPDHTILKFDDIHIHNEIVPGPLPEHALQIVNFGRKHKDSNLLIHCNAGQSRSTAAGIIIITDRLGDGSEIEAIKTMDEMVEFSVPNLQLIKYADEILNRNGSLVKALTEYENGKNCDFRLKSDDVHIQHWKRKFPTEALKLIHKRENNTIIER